jgi:hypothetical protein
LGHCSRGSGNCAAPILAVPASRRPLSPRAQPERPSHRRRGTTG